MCVNKKRPFEEKKKEGRKQTFNWCKFFFFAKHIAHGNNMTPELGPF